MTLDMFVFGILALAAIGTALAVLVSKNAIYSALFLVLNFASVGVLYLILGAPFVALAQIAVYAGAIMVLFLFVIMLLGGEKLGKSTQPRIFWVIAVGAALVFLAELGFGLYVRYGNPAVLQNPVAEFSDPAMIGQSLFGAYLLPFEITSIILLAGVVGAILLSRHEKKNEVSGTPPVTPETPKKPEQES